VPGLDAGAVGTRARRRMPCRLTTTTPRTPGAADRAGRWGASRHEQRTARGREAPAHGVHRRALRLRTAGVHRGTPDRRSPRRFDRRPPLVLVRGSRPRRPSSPRSTRGEARCRHLLRCPPASQRRGGKAEDAVAGAAAWIDLDFKDFPGGEAEARSRLAAFPIQPSIVVRSGHGLHAYYLLREPESPNRSRRSPGRWRARSAATTRSTPRGFCDFRARRIGRTPNTPVQVEIEVLDRNRCYNLSEIREAVDLVAPAASKSSQPQATPARPRLSSIRNCPPPYAPYSSRRSASGLLFTARASRARRRR
jgi:hypothetical protein